jgi:hypothetical protein
MKGYEGNNYGIPREAVLKKILYGVLKLQHSKHALKSGLALSISVHT